MIGWLPGQASVDLPPEPHELVEYGKGRAGKRFRFQDLAVESTRWHGNAIELQNSFHLIPRVGHKLPEMVGRVAPVVADLVIHSAVRTRIVRDMQDQASALLEQRHNRPGRGPVILDVFQNVQAGDRFQLPLKRDKVLRIRRVQFCDMNRGAMPE